MTWAHFSPEEDFAVWIRQVINMSMFHLTCSISPFRNLYEHWRMVLRAPFSKLAALTTSSVFNYMCLLELRIIFLLIEFMSNSYHHELSSR